MTIARALDEHFNEDELRMLVAEVGFEWEHLHGDARAARALDLVEAMDRRGRINDLIAAMRRLRPRMKVQI